MKLCIVIQSDAFRASAGMRIRYDRFRECLGGSDVSLDAETSANLVAASSFDHDVYIFCKTFDATALLLARRIRAAGKTIGQDLFDDYFSQENDPRLSRFREWLADMAPVTDYAICSTPRMVDVVRPYLPNTRLTSIDDPVIDFNPTNVGILAAEKAKRALETKTIEVVWFGIGDNPYFLVGLHDLVGGEGHLAALRGLGWTVNLRIVTNPRAFEAGGAEMLRELSVGYEVVEWTEAVEAEALERATLALLPVSGQSFSRAKSLNRAVTALSGGCQVLSIGFPLYQRLDAFIYRSVDDFHVDLMARSVRVRPDTVAALSALIEELASPVAAADAFVREARLAMAERAEKKESPCPIVCLLHGHNSTIELHKMVSASKGLSVGTPFSRAAWNFVVRFDIVEKQLVMRTTPSLADRYSLPIKDGRPVPIRALEFVLIDTTSLGVPPLPLHLPPNSAPIEMAAVYEDVIRFAEAACLAAFHPAEVLLSDNSPMRYRRRTPFVVPQDAVMPEPETRRVDSRETESVPTARNRWSRIFMGKAAHRQEALRMLKYSGLFDAEWYMREYPDVTTSGVAADLHYLQNGWQEGRDPGPQFSTKAYLKAHPDVAGQNINPLLHYTAHGKDEGRRISPSLRAKAQTAKIG